MRDPRLSRESQKVVKPSTRAGAGIIVHAGNVTSWSSSLEDVYAKVNAGNNPGLMTAIEATGLRSETHICSVSQSGRLYHTFSSKGPGTTNSYQSFFGDVGTKLGSSDVFVDVACAMSEENLELLAVTNDGRLLHATRFKNGSWTNSFVQLCPQANQIVKRVGCSSTIDSDNDKRLDVCVVTDNGGLFHTRRNSNGGWQNFFGQIGGVNATVVDVDCCMVSGTPTSSGAIGDAISLKIYAVSAAGNLIQIIRNGDHGWPNASQNVVVPGMGTAQYVSACQRGYRGTHVVIKNSAEEAQLLIQRDNDTWLSSSQDIGQIHNATPGGFIDVALTDWGANSVGFYGVKESL